MKNTESIKENRDFRRIYSKGKSAVAPTMVVYCRPNGRGFNRLGLTASTKLGGAVTRNRARRRLRECYRLSEDKLKSGFDIIIVARSRSVTASFQALEADFSRLCAKLELKK